MAWAATELLTAALCIFALPTTGSAGAAKCHNLLEIVIAVDANSSLTDGAFEDVKSEVKGIVKGFTVGDKDTRLALVRLTKEATVLAKFDAVKSLDGFNAAVDRMEAGEGVGDVSKGIKAAKKLLSSSKRAGKNSQLLILVKDRRFDFAPVSSTDALARIKTEAGYLKSSGVAIHAVGVGGLWRKPELDALYGTGYLLFKNKSKALESSKSSNKHVCAAECPRKEEKLHRSGLCYSTTKLLTNWDVFTTNAAGDSVCRAQIKHNFVACNGSDSCSAADRAVSVCGSNGKVTITETWRHYDYKGQECLRWKRTSEVDCAEASTCQYQKVDVFFLLDVSGSMREYENSMSTVKMVTRQLLDSLDIGPNNVHVGVSTFGIGVFPIVPMGSDNKEAVLGAIDNMSTDIERSASSPTALALKHARENLRENKDRESVPKYIFLITDGESDDKAETKKESKLTKDLGMTIYAIGIGRMNFSELEEMTAPETKTNLVTFSRFSQLAEWVDGFCKQICVRLVSPPVQFCQDKVVIQSVSKCTNGVQNVNKVEYKFDSMKNCIKHSSTTAHATCKRTCTDPLNGNEYLDGDTWSNACHQFRCTPGSVPLLPTESKCIALDGTCKEVNSGPFECRDVGNRRTVSNCKCELGSNGKPVIVIDLA